MAENNIYELYQYISYNPITAITPFSPCYCDNRPIGGNGTPQGIVIHSTGCKNPNLSRWVNCPTECGENKYENYFGGNNNKWVQPHAVAGLDKYGDIAIAKILPYTMCCYGCASGYNGSYNNTHIQIEIAEDYEDSYEYCEQILNAVCEWCAILCHIYNIPVSEIVSHKEAHEKGFASGHGDPEHWITKHGFTMDTLRNNIRKILADIEDKTPKPKDKLYRVQVGAFKNYDNAIALRDKLKSIGYDCFIV